LQAAVDAARERMNQNAGAVAAYNEIIALLDERPDDAPEPTETPT
jgi:hypothetical protein